MRKQVDLSKFKQNIEISGGRNIVRKLLWYYVSILIFQGGVFPISKLKVFILRLFGAKIGSNVNIKPQVYVKFPWRLQVGNNVWIGEKVWIANEANVTIGNNVCLSHECLILSGGHNYSKVTFDVYANPIIIEDGAWLGAQSSIGGGIIIGSHAVLAMKSVANSNLEPYSVYRGNPAIKIRERIIN
jgi:putative colanic acid biosynthesis acetyltransferase WcaF